VQHFREQPLTSEERAVGLFDIFKSKKKEESAPQPGAAASPWRSRLANYGDLSDAKQWALCEQLLGDIAPAFDNPKIKKLPDDDEIELRARLGDLPVRINFEVDMGWVRPEMKISNRTGELQLERDHENTPMEKDADDDWADEDELRVFVAKGIFAEGGEEEINQTLSTLGALPEAMRTELLTEMERLRLSRMYAFVDSMSAGFDPNHYEMNDPVRDVIAAAQLMQKLAGTLSQGSAGAGAAAPGEFQDVEDGELDMRGGGFAPAAAVQRVKCKYCSTLFVLGTTSNCPNCGAAHTG
jgi:hypothetical protein